jgi:hypothetical protein
VGRCLNQGEARDPKIRVFEAKSLPYAGGEFVGVDGGHSSCDAAGAEAASECHCRQHVRSIRGGMGIHGLRSFQDSGSVQPATVQCSAVAEFRLGVVVGRGQRKRPAGAPPAGLPRFAWRQGPSPQNSRQTITDVNGRLIFGTPKT